MSGADLTFTGPATDSLMRCLALMVSRETDRIQTRMTLPDGLVAEFEVCLLRVNGKPVIEDGGGAV